MYQHPLMPPEDDSPLVRQFLDVNGIAQVREPVDLLTSAARAFAQLPFENLTKII
jgi:hypothetical protein